MSDSINRRKVCNALFSLIIVVVFFRIKFFKFLVIFGEKYGCCT